MKMAECTNCSVKETLNYAILKRKEKRKRQLLQVFLLTVCLVIGLKTQLYMYAL